MEFDITRLNNNIDKSVLVNETYSFTLDEMKEGISYAHRLGKKVYLTINLFTHNHDLPRLNEFISHLKDLNPDGVIVADPGVFELLKRKLPDLPRHISTQANILNYEAVKFWHEIGATRAILARELPIKDVAEIKKQVALRHV